MPKTKSKDFGTFRTSFIGDTISPMPVEAKKNARLRYTRWRAIASIAAILFLAIAAVGQRGNDTLGPNSSGEPLRVNVNLVNFFFAVRNSHGEVVRHLDRSDFRVSDNGRPQGITHFAEISEQPLVLAVVLDKSGSVGDHFAFERKATVDFIRSILRPSQDKVLLITFDKQPHLAVRFTDNAQAIEQATAGLEAEGGTALFDAALMAIKQLGSTGVERKALILVTDGEDTVSWATQKDVLHLAISQNVAVYTLGLKADAPGAHEAQARENLIRLSEGTGGTALFPKDSPKELAELFARIEEELRNQYSLAYSLPPNDGTAFHRVVIEPANHSYRIHSRRGYYSSTASGNEPVIQQSRGDDNLCTDQEANLARPSSPGCQP